jgi:PKD repeat protein
MRAMSRRSALSIAAVGALALPSSALATTFTVNPTASAGCNTDHVCKTILDANGAIADGDTVVIANGTYSETGPIVVTRSNVTFKGTPGKVAITQTDGKTDTPVFALGAGDVLDGLLVSVQKNGAQAVLATAAGATVRNTTLARALDNSTDAPVLGSTAPGGAVVLQGSIVIQNPATGGSGRPAAVLGNLTSSIQISDSVIVSGPGSGPGIRTTGAAPSVPHTLVRSQVLALDQAANGITLTASDTQPTAQSLNIDSSIISPGANGTGIAAGNTASLTNHAGAIAIAGVHTTIAGGSVPVSVSSTVAPAAFLTGTPAGPVTASFDRSIVHGVNPSTTETGSTLLNGSSVATIALLRSDATDSPGTGITVTDGQKSTDAALFADPASRNYHLRLGSPAIDKGGAAVNSESDRDVAQQPRSVGAATDLGADEFVNLPPRASFTAPATVRQGQAATFDGSKSSDPESGGGVAKYRWNFGDGQTAETTTATTTHVYAKTGSYTPTLTVVDVNGNPSTTVTGSAIAVTDGTPPEVRITTPKAGATLRVFKTTRKTVKVKTKSGKTVTRTKVTRTRNRFDFRGTAADDAGVASVEMSLRRVSLGARAAASSCVFLDGKTSFVSRSCTKPVFFPVAVDAQGFWNYRTKKGLKVRPGRYELSVRATDKAGVVSAPVKITLTIK